MAEPRNHWLTTALSGPWLRIESLVYQLTSRGAGGVNIFSLSVQPDNRNLSEADCEALAEFVRAAPETAAERDRLKEQRDELLKALRESLAVSGRWEARSIHGGYDDCGEPIHQHAERVRSLGAAAIQKATT